MKSFLAFAFFCQASMAQFPQMTGSPTTLVSEGGRVSWSSKNIIAYDFQETSGAKDGYYDLAIINPDGSGNTCLTCPGSAGVGALPSPSLNIGNPQFTPDGNFLIFMVQIGVSVTSCAASPTNPVICNFPGFPGEGYRCDLWATDMMGHFWQLTTQGRWGVAGILTAVAVTPGTDSGLPNSGTFTTTGGGCSPGAAGTFTASGGNLLTVTLTTGGSGAGCTSNPTFVPNSGSLGTSTVRFIGSGGVIYPTISHDGTKLTWGQRDLPGVTEDDNLNPGRWDLAYATFSETGGIPSIGSVTLVCSGTTASYCTGTLGTQPGYVEPHTFSNDNGTIFFMGNVTANMNAFARNIYSFNLGTSAFFNLTNSLVDWTEYPTAVTYSTKLIYMLYPNAGGQHGQNINCIADYWVMNYDGTDKYQLTFFNTPGNVNFQPTPGQPVCTDDPSWNPTSTQLVMFPNFYAASGHTGTPGPDWIINISNVSSALSVTSVAYLLPGALLQ